MPVIEVLFHDLQELVGRSLPRGLPELTELLSYVKGEAVGLSGDSLSIEVKDGNRPDLWCVEGIARELSGVLGVEVGLKDYSVKSSSRIRVDVDSRLKAIRPYIAASVVKSVRLTGDIIGELMRFQDKLDQTYGRRRRRASIGLYNYGLISSPLQYGVSHPESLSFTPLGGDEELNLREILQTHPKGITYGHIVEEHEQWPILVDSEGMVLSMPPIINSDDLGKLTEGVKDVFVEVTGTDHRTVLNTLTIVTLSLADRGRGIYSVEVNYPYDGLGATSTPQLETGRIRLNLGLVNGVLGLGLESEEAVRLLKRAGYHAQRDEGDTIDVTVPCYRMDVIHPLDVVEDVAIMKGYNDLQPRWPQQITFGGISSTESFSDLVREIMVGLGFQEVLSFSLTNPVNLFERMNLAETGLVEILNPASLRFTCIRSWLLPSLLGVLSKNTDVEYPQRVFEVGDCAVLDKSQNTGVRDFLSLACSIAHSRSSFSEVKGVLDAFSINVGFNYRLVDSDHRSFIEGRVGGIIVKGRRVGVIGELSPRVLEAWGLENPVTGFEVNLIALMDLVEEREV